MKSFLLQKTLPLLLAFIVLLIPRLSLSQDEGVLLPEDPLKGRIVFEKKGCVKCHAVFGYGGKSGPDLGHYKFFGSLLDLAGVMWNHSPQMNQKMVQSELMWPQFTEEEMLELLSYIYFLPYLGDVGDAKNGEKLLKNKGCLNCHSLGGKGGKEAIDLSALGRYASPLYMAQTMWNHLPSMEEQMQTTASRPPHLTGKEMVDISTFIRQVNPKAAREKIYMSPGNPKKGKQLFAQKGCASCHVTSGSKEGAAPDLTHSNLRKSVLEIAAVLWNHGSEMLKVMHDKKMEFPRFEGSEMADLMAYLYFLTSTNEEGDPARGEKLFKDKGCISCHDTRGNEQLIGPSVKEMSSHLTPISLVQSMWNHAGIMKVRMLEQDLPWPTFKKGDMKDLNAYFKSVRERGKK